MLPSSEQFCQGRKSVKRFELSKGLDAALYKNIPLHHLINKERDTMATHLVTANRQQDVLARDLEARTHLSLEVRLEPIFAEACHLARTRHLHAQQDVSAR